MAKTSRDTKTKKTETKKDKKHEDTETKKTKAKEKEIEKEEIKEKEIEKEEKVEAVKTEVGVIETGGKGSPNWGVLLSYIIIGLVIGAGGLYLYTHFNDNSGGGILPATSGIVKTGDKVTITYTLKSDNYLVESSTESFIVGSGKLLEGIEEAISGMKKGEEKTITIPPGKAYGQIDPSKIQEIPRTITNPAVIEVTPDEFKRAAGQDPTPNQEYQVQGLSWPIEVINVTNITKNITSDERLKNIQGVETLSDVDNCHVQGKVTILEFSDFKCPYCNRAVPIVEQIKENYGEKVEVIFRQYPLPFHQGADKAAEATECARDQSKFWEMHDALFNAGFTGGQDVGNLSILKNIGAEIELDTTRFNNCLDNREKQEKVKADMTEAAKYGITGTPAFVLDCNTKISGAYPYDTFKQTIDALLTEGNQTTITYNEVKVTIKHKPAPGTIIDMGLGKVTEVKVEGINLIITHNPTIGTEINTPTGKARITEIKDTTITLDLNNPLAGKTLTATIRIDDIEAKKNSTGTGTETAKVKILEFSDFQCPYCARAVPIIEQIKQDYGDQVEIEFKHFPLNFHQNAQKAAEASECARDQSKFWEMHDKLFQNQNALDIPNLKKYAKDLGLDTGKFDKCLDEGEKTGLVQNDFKEGQTKGVSGTPTFLINDQKIVGAQPYEKFKEIIDQTI